VEILDLEERLIQFFGGGFVAANEWKNHSTLLLFPFDIRNKPYQYLVP